MKKSVILTILAIYVMAIVVVGIWGIKTYFFNPTVYVKEITLIDSLDGVYKVETYAKEPDIDFIRIDFSIGLKFNLWYRINPDDATRKDVEFDFTYGKHEGKIEVSSEGVVSILVDHIDEPIIIDGNIRSTDGKNVKSRTIRIQVSLPKA